MPVLTIQPTDSGFTLGYFAPWQWTAYEGIPNAWWILKQTIVMYEARRRGEVHQAAVIRQQLQDRNMQVENHSGGGVTVKW